MNLRFFLKPLKTRTLQQVKTTYTWPTTYTSRKVAETTSCAEGGSSPAPGTPRRSKSDMANALAAAQARRQLHLRYQAALTLPHRTLASERDFSQARLQRKAFVSSDHLPPTSPAITTIRTTILPMELRVRLLFVSPCFQQRNAVCLVRVPSVDPVRMQKPTTKWRPRPAGCRRETSLQQQLPVFFRPLKRALGPSPNLARRCSWKPVLHPLDTPARPRSPLQIPYGSRPRLSNTLLCDGHRGQVGGHKNNGEQKRARANGDGAEGPLGRVRNPSWRRGGLAMLSTGRKLAGHSENGLVPVRWNSNRAIKLSHENARGLQ